MLFHSHLAPLIKRLLNFENSCRDTFILFKSCCNAVWCLKITLNSFIVGGPFLSLKHVKRREE